eukprot:c19368_g1_i2.p1 GENE.c19368_g1_i2~~c19368_g1_i2.p1  ORF type:complete len:133 (+),score=53.20 c19368_g1_i2:66-464(+)
MFTYNLPFAAIIRMWDWLFVEGHDIVFIVALAVLKLVSGKMLKLKGTDLLEYSMTFSGQLEVTADVLIHEALEFKEVLKTIDSIRTKAPQNLVSLPSTIQIYSKFTNQNDQNQIPFFLRNKFKNRNPVSPEK